MSAHRALAAALLLALALPTALAAPTVSVVLCTAQSDGVHLSWTAQAGAASYNVYRQTNSGPSVFLHNVVGTSYVDGTVAAGNSYTYTVKAVNGGGAEFKTVGTCSLASVPFLPGPAQALAVLGIVGCIPLAFLARRRKA